MYPQKRHIYTHVVVQVMVDQVMACRHAITWTNAD